MGGRGCCDLRLPRGFRIAAGVAAGLHLLSFGSGTGDLTSLILVRFAAAVLAGALCGASERDERAGVGDDDDDDDDDNAAPTSGIARPTLLGLVPTSGAAEGARLSGLALSALWGGSLYGPLTGSADFRAVTGGYPRTLTPAFLVAVALWTDAFLLCLGSPRQAVRVILRSVSRLSPPAGELLLDLCRVLARHLDRWRDERERRRRGGGPLT